jgi:peptidoglycan/xylan/chitin deacetylase (PgdA/CDA1 family)
MYHRVSEKIADPWYLCVSPGNFSEHLRLLQKHARPVSLDQLVRMQAQGKIEDRTVAVTFDDGYADSLHTAKPLLEQYGTPATVFVTTGYVGGTREFWWDELERALLRPGRLPETLHLRTSQLPRRWDLGSASAYSESEFQHDCIHDRDSSSRLAFYYSVWESLQPLSQQERQEALCEIRAWADADSAARSSHRILGREEVRTLAAGGLVEVGAHTTSHEMLPIHSEAVQRREIEESKRYLEDLLGNPVRSFSYPFGEYAENTVSLVRQAGFDSACTVTKGPVYLATDRFQLPRFAVHNAASQKFEKDLLRWLRG